MIKIAGVWPKDKDDGTTFFSGKIQLDAPLIISDEHIIFIFPNENAKENAPKYNILISKARQREGGGNGKPVEL